MSLILTDQSNPERDVDTENGHSSGEEAFLPGESKTDSDASLVLL